MQLVAQLVEQLLFDNRPKEALDEARETRDEPLGSGPRLLVELDALEALERSFGSTSAEPAWDRLLAWASQENPETSAVVWQRRGATLARRDDPANAQQAYFKAAQLWRSAESEAGVRDAYFSAQV